MSALTTTARGIALSGLVIGSVAAPAWALAAADRDPEPLPVKSVEAAGPTHTYGDAYAEVRTKVTASSLGGKTKVTFDASGFPGSDAGKVFGVHAHQKPCGAEPADAGSHHENPDATPDASPSTKEVWLDVRIGQDGRGHSEAEVPWVVQRGTAGSIVVHAEPTNQETGAAGARLLCTTVPFGT